MYTTNPFTTTKNLYTEALAYSEPFDFDGWSHVDDDLKAAVLYVQFFPEISLAWFKADSLSRGCQEDGVSVVLQYLQKNVPIIMADSRKFTPQYIYRVAYNCLYCLCHDIKRDKERFKFEISNIVYSANGDELDLCDLVPVHDEDFTLTKLKAMFWGIVDSMDDDHQYVVSRLMGEDIPGLRRVGTKKRDAIIEELREKLARFENVSFS